MSFIPNRSYEIELTSSLGSTTSTKVCSFIISSHPCLTLRADWANYKDRLLLRSQQVANAPEIIRRLGVIAMNTPLEVDIYAHANSTCALGSRLASPRPFIGCGANDARQDVERPWWIW